MSTTSTPAPARAALQALCALLAAACTSQEAPPAEPVAEAEPLVRQENLPTPYTADQIRASCTEGTELVYLLEYAGQPPVIQTMRFVQADAEGAVIETFAQAEDGSSLGAAEASESTWEELRDHAAFPAAMAERSRASFALKTGEFECWLYTVRDEEADTTTRFFFADGAPGPPIIMEVEEAGGVVFRMALLEESRP